jgi:hypothetical protein
MAGSAQASRAARLGFETLLCLGLAASGSPAQNTVHTRRHRGAASQYLAIAKAGNRRLDHDFDRLHGPDRHDLRRSRADLRDIAAAEHVFDRRLLRIKFQPRVERTARSLYRANQRRAMLTITAAGSSSLAAVRAYEQLLNAANSPVERAVRTLRRELGLPPPPSS